MITTIEDSKKLINEMNYKGCKNCVHQISTLRMCEWSELGGDGQIHLICPKWEEKKRGDKIG